MSAGTASLNSFGARASLDAAGEPRTIYRLDRAAEALGLDLARLPFTLRVLLENLLRGEDGSAVTREQIEATRGLGWVSGIYVMPSFGRYEAAAEIVAGVRADEARTAGA